MKLPEMKTGLAISALCHAALLLWGLLSFAAKPVAAPPRAAVFAAPKPVAKPAPLPKAAAFKPSAPPAAKSTPPQGSSVERATAAARAKPVAIGQAQKQAVAAGDDDDWTSF